MKTEIIVVGTEILMGYITDTNSGDISQSLLDIGIGTFYQSVVGDNEERIQESLERASSRSDIIFLVGGLGPTEDDITKLALAKFLGEDLIQDMEQARRIEEYFARSNRTVTENNYRQAHSITNGQVILNEVGLATGLIYERNLEQNKIQYYIVLPGPPFEMRHMVENYVKPYLLSKFRDLGAIESKYININGLGEAQVANDLDDLINNQDNPTIAVYAQPKKVTVRLTANAPTLEEARNLNDQLAKKIVKRLGNHFIGYGADRNLEDYIVDLLRKDGKNLSVAESLTGGLVLESVTNVPGASKILKGGLVAYQNDIKVNILKIKQETLDRETVVSKQVAIEMAENIRQLMNTDFGLGLTGVAGPGALEGHKAGTVFIALSDGKESFIKELHINHRPREVVKDISKNEALNLLKEYYEK